MRNIVNIIKYNIIESAILYSIEIGLILLVCVIANFSSVNFGDIGYTNPVGKAFSEDPSSFLIGSVILLIPTVICIISINFVINIINFSKQLSKDRGRLLFMTPVKGGEFMVAKYLEFIVTNIPFFMVAIIPFIYITSIMTVEFQYMSAVVIIPFFGILMAYMLTTSLIVIARSYVTKTILVVVLVIIGLMLVGTLTDSIEYILPNLYISIDKAEFGLIKPILNIISMIILSIFASENLNNKLDIN